MRHCCSISMLYTALHAGGVAVWRVEMANNKRLMPSGTMLMAQ